MVITNGIRQESCLEFNAVFLSTLKSNTITEWKKSQIKWSTSLHRRKKVKH